MLFLYCRSFLASQWGACCVFAILLLFSGCANVPPHMRVVEGIRPENADKDVRFRTTYFFRVYDFCYDDKARTKLQPVSDSLYRFVMTGKANVFANRVRFESGTLKASQIDPFGATIEFDDETNRMRFVPEAEVQARARSSQVQQQIEALIELKRNLIKLNQTDGEDSAVDSSTLEALDKSINALVASGLTPNPAIEAAAESGDPETVLVCPPGSEIQRGFQIMGPQGVKTFDQDERLIMAMSSDAKPLLAALEEVSGRFLKAEEEKTSSEAFLLSIVREQLRVSEMNRSVLAHPEPKDAQALLAAVRSQLAPPQANE